MPQQPRYVQLPNGSYLEWPEGVSAEEFKAKAGRISGSSPITKPDTAVDKMFPTGGTVGVPHPRTGLAGAEDKLANLATRLSQFAQKGVGQGAGDFMMSLPLGALKVAKGGTEIPQGKFLKGTGDILGGAAEAATIPGAFVAPEASEAIKAALPSGKMKQAGEIFEQLEKAVGKVPVDTQEATNTASEIRKFANSGGQQPKVVRDLIRRVSDPNQPPMNYSDLRKFYINSTRLSAEESGRLSDPIKRQIGELTQKMGDAAYAAAQSGGMGQEYNKAMRLYRDASKMREIYKKVLKAVGTAAIGAGAYRAYEGLK